MSQNTLPDPQAAFRKLADDVYAGGMLEVLAARGYPARTQKEAQELLALSARVKSLAPPQKQASDVYAEAAAALDRLAPAGPDRRGDATEAGLRKYAAALAADPGVYNAVLSLKAAEADGYARGA